MCKIFVNAMMYCIKVSWKKLRKTCPWWGRGWVSEGKKANNKRLQKQGETSSHILQSALSRGILDLLLFNFDFFFISSQVSFSNEDSACPEYYFLLKCWDINGCCRARAPRTSSHLTSITDSHTPSLPCFTWPLSLRS